MVSLRMMTLTDQENQPLAAVDGCGLELLVRTENYAREQLRDLHGQMRKLRTVSRESNDG